MENQEKEKEKDSEKEDSSEASVPENLKNKASVPEKAEKNDKEMERRI